jgi:peptide subunit release factor 1 (eRF1)
VQAALQRAGGVLKGLRRIPPTGLVMLADPTECVAFAPPRPVPRAVYTCGPRFSLEWLYAMLQDDLVFGFLGCDGSTITGYTMRTATESVKVFTVTSMAAGRTRRGGQSAARISRIRDEQQSTFVHRAAEAAAEAWGGRGGPPTVAGVFVVGCGAVTKQTLPGELRACAPKLPVLGIVAAADVTNPLEMWHRTADARAAAGRAPAATTEARVATLLETDPDLLLWGAAETCTGLAAGLVECVLAPAAEAAAEVAEAVVVMAGDRGVPVHVSPRYSDVVAVLRYKTAAVKYRDQ